MFRIDLEAHFINVEADIKKHRKRTTAIKNYLEKIFYQLDALYERSKEAENEETYGLVADGMILTYSNPESNYAAHITLSDLVQEKEDLSLFIYEGHFYKPYSTLYFQEVDEFDVPEFDIEPTDEEIIKLAFFGEVIKKLPYSYHTFEKTIKHNFSELKQKATRK